MLVSPSVLAQEQENPLLISRCGRPSDTYFTEYDAEAELQIETIP